MGSHSPHRGLFHPGLCRRTDSHITGSLHGLLGYPENSFPACFHEGFFIPDFQLLTIFSLLIGGMAWTTWEILRRLPRIHQAQ